MKNNLKMKDSKIVIIIGTRAELIKSFPIMLELQKQKIPYCFIHTGQHNLQDLCKRFKVKKPEIVLSHESKEESKFWSKINKKSIFWNIDMIFKIKKILKKFPKLKYVLYHGDTMTTASASIGSSRLLSPFKKYKNAHLEAGLRSWNYKEPFPEEISRIIAGRFSDILFAVSETSKNNLKKYWKKKRVINVGNSVVDSIYLSYNLAKKNKTKIFSNKKFALVSIHRHENIINKKRLSAIVEILQNIKIPTYFALHQSTKRQLIKFALYKKLRKNKNIIIIPTQEYSRFIYQIKHASLIICDGGSMQEESLIFHIPCILLRKATERPEGLNSNFQSLIGVDIEKAKRKIKEYLHRDFKIEKFKNPYGEKGLTKKIVDVLVG